MHVFIIKIFNILSTLRLFNLYYKFIRIQCFRWLFGIESVKHLWKILDIPHSYRRLVLSGTILAGNTNLTETLVDTEIGTIGQLIHTSGDSRIVFLHWKLLFGGHPFLFLIIPECAHTPCVLMVALADQDLVLYVHFILYFEVLDYLKIFVIV